MSNVVPVVDYEPPTVHAPGPVRLTRRRAPAEPTRPAQVPDTTPLRAAGGFADAALRRVLEVIDRRRPLAQLRPLMAAGLVDSLLAAVAHHDRRSAARLRRLRVQPVGTDGTTAEVAAVYTRDQRVRAIACRVQQVPTAGGVRWQIVALHIG